MFKRINRLLCLISKRYKFHRICKAIGIKPYKWQKEYALGKILTLPKNSQPQRAVCGAYNRSVANGG